MPGTCIYSEFFHAHPEYHCKTHDGTPVTRLSFAEPEVQQHFLRLFDEMTDFDLDGLNLILMRSVPLIAFEHAFCRAFQDAYDISPLDLPEDDQRILALRKKMVTDFFRQIRKLLEDVAPVRHDDVPVRHHIARDHCRKGVKENRKDAARILHFLTPARDGGVGERGDDDDGKRDVEEDEAPVTGFVKGALGDGE